jgi:hypothetical protein
MVKTMHNIVLQAMNVVISLLLQIVMKSLL